MHFALVALGTVLILGGLGSLGFGIPINAFSLGNTLIITGIVAISGGAIVLGLALVARLLRRILDVLQVSRVPVVSLPIDAPVETRAPRLSPMSLPSAADRSAEPLATDDAPMIQAADETPLSPRSARRPVEPSREEPKAWSPRRLGESDTDAPESDSDAARAIAERRRERRRDRGRLDAAYPGARPAEGSGDDDAPLPHAAPEVQSPITPPKPIGFGAATDDPSNRPVSILKAGVIDGMAYTLYADGSIEAELPEGKVRFASVDALRSHIEQTG